LTILHVVAPAPVGGLERVVEMLARGHAAAGHEVRVAAVVGREEHEHAFVRSLNRAGVEVETLALPGRAYLRERAAVLDVCRRVRPSVVHSHGARPDVVDAGVARGLGIPVVTTVHGLTGGGLKNRFYERLQLRAFRRFDGVVAVSRPLADLLARKGVPGPRIHIVPNAWSGKTGWLSRAEARAVLGIPADGYYVGWVGRVSREKGPDVLFRALPLLADLPLSVVMLGAGPLLDPLRAQARASGLDDRIVCRGLVPDAARLYAAFNVFVLSSRTEGTPIALFEAMAAGVPVVSTRVGGVPDVVSEREAVLVPPDDTRALAAAIRSSFSNPSAAATRALAARARLVTEYAEEPWLARYEAIYRAVQGARSGQPAGAPT